MCFDTTTNESYFHKLTQNSGVQAYMQTIKKQQFAAYAHSLRIARLFDLCIDEYGIFNEHKNSILIGCLLHEYGMLVIPRSILKKQGHESLSEKEQQYVQIHPIFGFSIIDEKLQIGRQGLEILLYHHEQWSGKGYPFGLKKMTSLNTFNAFIY